MSFDQSYSKAQQKDIADKKNTKHQKEGGKNQGRKVCDTPSSTRYTVQVAQHRDKREEKKQAGQNDVYTACTLTMLF
jgi:hypothetical protein